MKLRLVGALSMGAMLLASANYAQAGTFTATATTYAKEALSADPTIVAPSAVYTMGVKRDFGKDFTMIFTLPAGVTFDTDPVLAYTGGTSPGEILVAKKRDGAGSGTVAYDVTMPTADDGSGLVGSVVSVGDTFTLSSINVAGATRSIICGGLSLTVALKDFGESARIDNSTDKATDLAACAQASNFVYGGDDTAGLLTDINLTTVDASGPAVPMAGFVVANDDTATMAKATIEVKTHQNDVMTADGSARYDLYINNDVVTITLTDLNGTGFQGLAADGLCFDMSDDGVCDAGEIFTVDGNTATLDITVTDDGYGNALPAGLNRDREIIFTSDGVIPMSTNQSFGISGKVTPDVDATNVLAFTAPAGVWWDWASNGVMLQAPFAQNPAGWLCRTVLTNTGSTPANFQVSVMSETGIVVTTRNTSGVVPANGTVVNACTDFLANITGGLPRLTFNFTVNAPSDNIQGLYQIVNAASGSISNHVMVRPGTN